MTPEQEQALHDHTQAIASTLYEHTPPEQLNTLGGIEQAVREQMQNHVMPAVGVFLSQRQREPAQDVPVGSKASLEHCVGPVGQLNSWGWHPTHA